MALDLGCGEGRLYEYLQLKRKSLSQNLRSFDLQATKNFIEVCDIKNLPVETNSSDLTVFCLSLMGTNYSEFL